MFKYYEANQNERILRNKLNDCRKKADKYNLFIVEISGEFYIYRKHKGSKNVQINKSKTINRLEIALDKIIKMESTGDKTGASQAKDR